MANYVCMYTIHKFRNLQMTSGKPYESLFQYTLHSFCGLINSSLYVKYYILAALFNFIRTKPEIKPINRAESYWKKKYFLSLKKRAVELHINCIKCCLWTIFVHDMYPGINSSQKICYSYHWIIILMLN